MEINTILNATRPEQIFSMMDENVIKKEYKEFIFDIHPDRNKDLKAMNATMHLNMLYKNALEKVKKGIWASPDVIYIKANTGQVFKQKYIISGSFDLGYYYIGDKHISYHIKPEWNKLFDNAINMIEGFKYKSENIEKEVIKYLPKVVKNITAIDGTRILIIEKDPDMILLKDLLKYYKGSIDPKHVAWIMSSLHNLCCYFHIEGICHNDISMDTYFISPKGHSGALYGGWWYSRHSGDKLLSVPERTFKLMPSKQVNKKIASRSLNLELIRDIGIDLLGGKDAPSAMLNWLKMPPMKNAIEDYKVWSTSILKKSFGERKFVKMDVTSNQVYQTKEK